MELADTSAWVVQARSPDVRERFSELLVEGEIAICDMVKLELLAQARNGSDFDRRRQELDDVGYCPIRIEEWERALDVYGALAHRGGAHQRSVKHADLLIAAAAEAAGVPVLHYDEDYDRIAAITGQPTRWIVERGTL